MSAARFTVTGAYTGRIIALAVGIDVAREHLAGFPTLAGELDELAVGETASSHGPGAGIGVTVKRVA